MKQKLGFEKSCNLDLQAFFKSIIFKFYFNK